MDKDNSTSDVPDWINTDLLKKILCPHGKENTIKSWKIEKGTAPGDNYASIIYRVSMDLVCSEKLENKSLIIKVELINKEVSKIASEGNAFTREIHIYNTIIPQMNKMLEEMFPNKFQPFAPYCYYTHLGPPGSVLVFEDLRNESFRLAERTVGLDMRHSLLVLRSLAVYHASSVVLFQKQPDVFEPLKSSVYKKSSSDSIKSLFSTVLRDFAEELEKWPGYKERFSEKIRNIADRSVDIILDGVERDEGDFNVLAHEDPWLNNIMFRYSEALAKLLTSVQNYSKSALCLNNAMGEIPPDWINSEFLEKALRSNGNHPNLTVVSYDIKRAALAGDHYASEMYRATLETKENGETEEISIIIKCKLRGGELSQVVDFADIFLKEAMTFTDIHIPLFSILKDAYGDNMKPLAAKCIYTSTEPEAIILEDLKKEGFRLAGVTDGLDLKHCLLVMRAIAKYHAASLILRLQDPSRFKVFADSFFAQVSNTEMNTFLSSAVRSVRDEIKTWPGYEKYMGSLNALESAAIHHWVNGVRRDEAGFNVLIHGDLWMNNMMFRYSEGSGEVEDIRLVDFQLSYLGSPATDLQYFMNSSASYEVLVNDRHVLIEEYYKTLCETLSKLGHQNLQPTKHVLNTELDKKGLFGSLTAFTIRAFAQADRDHIPDIDNLMKNNASLHLSEPYKDGLKKLLPFYEKWGWLKI